MDSYFVGNMCGCRMNCTAFKGSSVIVWQDRHLPHVRTKWRGHCPIGSHGFLYMSTLTLLPVGLGSQDTPDASLNDTRVFLTCQQRSLRLLYPDPCARLFISCHSKSRPFGGMAFGRSGPGDQRTDSRCIDASRSPCAGH